MDRSHLIIAFLAGVCVALGTALVLKSGDVLPRAHAQASGGGEMFAVTGTGTSGQGRDILFVIDGRTQRLMVYEYKEGRIILGGVRNMEYDALFQEWSPRGKEQKPSVKEMRAAQNKGGGTKKKRRRR